MREFKDKVAVVTGAASGIGFALADRLASVGMRVVLCDVEQAALENAERTLKTKGAPTLLVAADVSKAEDVERLADKAFETFGGVHVLCNNAGVGMGGLIWENSLDDWRWVLGVNLWGVIHGIRSFVPRMLAQDSEGHIVNTASVAGLISSPYIGVYQASKHAVVSITETLRLDLEATGAKLRASVLCPGFVQTKIADSDRNRPSELTNSQRQADIDRQRQVREVARQQVASGVKPAEVAEMTVEAIREDRFYVLTHQRFEKLIRRRMQGIIDGSNPKLDFGGDDLAK
jgi:NAD(P)-dependent dehydrogenase (short-subunit alcohol dehydrogenase family)